MGIDIKNCFLMTNLPTGDREYMRIHGRFFQEDFRNLYNIHDKIAPDGYVYCEVMLGMYGLKQAAMLAYNQINNA